MIRRFPLVAITAATLALSLTASASMAGNGQLGQVAEQLKTALAADPVEVTQKVGSVTLTSSADKMFPSGGWQVPSSAPLLDKMLPTLSKLQNTKIVVAGYTDNVPVGEELKAKGVTNNLDLSAERAVSIANYLTAHGVKPDLVSVHGFGETNPAASNDTPEGQAKNRRVDITLTVAPEGGTCIERIRDIDLTEAQEATIAGIRDEYAPKVEEAVTALKSVIDEELNKLRAVLTPEQLVKIENMKEERKTLRLEGLAARIAHLRDLDLTEDEMAKIEEIRNEYCPTIVQALEGLKGTLTPEQAKIREDALKAGKSRREVIASLRLTDDQKAKVESVGKEVRTLVQEELAKMRDVLTPEQQEKIGTTKEDRREHVRDRFAFRIANLKELDLTDQQVSQIKAIRAEYRPKVQEAGNNLRAIVREEIAAIVAVLKA
jgi:chemotaxis protein MotB